jgi:peroxiredoxin Q/BCP
MKAILPVVLVVALAGSVSAAEMRKTGESFPSWSLLDHTGARVTSDSLTGKKYLLWFYPRAMTPGCTAEGRALRDHFAEFERQGVEILGVSFDTPKDNAEFVGQEKFPFRLLSDSDGALAVAVGAARSADQGYASRISYLIGKDGKVLRAYGSVSPAGHAEQVLGDL